MKYFYLILVNLSFIIAIDNPYTSIQYNSSNLNSGNQYDYSENHSFDNYDYQILHNFIDSDRYVVGPGDIFLFNMITSNRVINLNLITSPTGNILIPIIGTINIKGMVLSDVYSMIINKCKDKYEDAYIYVNLIKLRNFKVLVTGNFEYSGMHPVSATNRVSDLFESIINSSNYLSADSLLYSQISDYPKYILFSKDIFLIRQDSIINIDLFDYYMNSNFDFNPYLREGDIINIKNSKKIALIGEVDIPIRIDRPKDISYRELLIKNNIDNIKSIKMINYNMLKNYSSSEIDRISNIDSEYRSDFDESFLSSRIRSIKGLYYVNNNKELNEFLDLKVSDADILIIPNKIEYIEIIGAVNKPGSYKFNDNFTILNYLDKAGNFSMSAKNKNIYLIDNISGVRIKINSSYQPRAGDVIFIEEKLGYKNWKRFTESIKLAGTLSTMLASIVNIFWIIDRINE